MLSCTSPTVSIFLRTSENRHTSSSPSGLSLYPIFFSCDRFRDRIYIYHVYHLCDTPSVPKYKTPFNFVGQRYIILTMICSYNIPTKLVYRYIKKRILQDESNYTIYTFLIFIVYYMLLVKVEHQRTS